MKVKAKYKISEKERLTVQENTMNQLDVYYSIKGTPVHSHTFANKVGNKTISGVTTSINGADNRHPFGTFVIDSEDIKKKITEKNEMSIDLLRRNKFLTLVTLGESEKDALVRTQKGGKDFLNSPVLNFSEFDLSLWECALTLVNGEVYFILKDGTFHTVFFGLINMSEDMRYYGRPLIEIYPQFKPIMHMLQDFLEKIL
jgi:hypothetical protein